MEVVRQLAEHNCANFALVARNKDRLDNVAKQLDDKDTVCTFTADLADSSAVEAVCQKAVAQLGGLDIVVFSAGNAGPEAFAAPVDSTESFAYLEKLHVHSTLTILLV